MTEGIFELAAVMLIAATLGVVARLLKQPLVLAYIATGALIGYWGVNVHEMEALHVFADLGIMFLLFLVGLEINYTALRLVGKTALIIGSSQIIFTSLAGYGIARLLGFEQVSSLYIGIALTLSSTIIAVKLLSEKQDISSLYGKITIGILLLQDAVVILMLVILGGVASGEGISFTAIIAAVVKGIFLFVLMLWLGRKILPFLFHKIARSAELLFLVSIAWVFLLAAVVSRVGFSVEIAGFLAGIALANSSEHFQIANRIKSLRDFFILIFFVILGSSIASSNFTGMGIPIILFSAFVIIGNPLIVMVVMGIMGYRKRTGLFTGLMIGQVSEFSMILAATGVKLGHIPDTVVSLVTAAAIISITVSSYLTMHSAQVFKVLKPFLVFFQRKNIKENGFPKEPFDKPIILVGANRIGENIARHIPQEDLLVIEFDPEIISELNKQGIDNIFGDVSDPEIFEKANFGHAKLVISTSPDLYDNLALLEGLNELDHRPKAIVRADTEEDANALYKAGADYVLLPHFTSGQYLAKTLMVDPEMRILENLKSSDMAMLSARHTNFHEV